jgi:hypothetical protein
MRWAAIILLVKRPQFRTFEINRIPSSNFCMAYPGR